MGYFMDTRPTGWCVGVGLNQTRNVWTFMERRSHRHFFLFAPRTALHPHERSQKYASEFGLSEWIELLEYAYRAEHTRVYLHVCT